MDALNAKLRKFRRQGYVPVGDFLDKRWVGTVEHDVKVLDGVHALEALPVLEPHEPVWWESRPERLVHPLVDLPVRFSRRQARLRVVLELEFDPDDEVRDAGLQPVRPVVAEDRDVICHRARQSVRMRAKVRTITYHVVDNSNYAHGRQYC